MNNIINANKKRFPGISDDQAAGREPILYKGKEYFLTGDGHLVPSEPEAPKKSNGGIMGTETSLFEFLTD